MALRFATSSPRERASASKSTLARRVQTTVGVPVRFLAAAGLQDCRRVVQSCEAGIWTTRVDLAATMTMTLLTLTSRQGEWRGRVGQEGVTERATCSSYLLSRVYG